MISDKTVSRILLGVILSFIISSGFAFLFNPVNSLSNYGLMSALLLFFFIDGVKGLLESILPSFFKTGKEDLRKVTVIIPAYNASETLGWTLKSLLRRFKPSQIIVSANGCTDDTVSVAKQYGVRVIDTKNPIGKVKAINVSLKFVNTPYTLIMDDDVNISDSTIPTSLLDEGYDGIAFRVIPSDNNIITAFQKHEYRKSMDISRKFHNRAATVQNISGALGLYRTTELKRQIKIHTGEFSGEDLQRTLLIHMSHGNKGTVICDSIVETDAPSSIHDLFYQRVIGWYPAVYSTFKYYRKLLFRKNTPITMRIEAFYNTILMPILDPFRLLTLPFFLFVPINFIIFYFIYVLLELIPYLKMKRQEPIWVVLLYPFYGVFNLVCRVIAMGVFLYRRYVVWLTRNSSLDDYKVASMRVKSSGLSLALISTLSIHTAYGYVNARIVPFEPYEQSTIRAYSAIVDEPYIVSLGNYETMENKPVIIQKNVTIKAQSGYGRWKIAETALDEYAYENSIKVNGQLRNRIIADVVNQMPVVKVINGQEYQVSKNILRNSINKHFES